MTGIEYRHANGLFSFYNLNLNYILSGHMVQGITDIISYDLLCFKLITPNRNRLSHDTINVYALLLNEDLARLQYPFDKLYNVKTFKGYLFIPKFQLIQSQKIPYHLIHFIGFIHDHIAIKSSALRIIADSFFQSFRIALNQSDRRFQFMRNIAKKFRTHLLQLFLLFNILLQLIIGAFQLRNRLFQLLRYFVKICPEDRYLVGTFARVFCIKIKIGHSL